MCATSESEGSSSSNLTITRALPMRRESSATKSVHISTERPKKYNTSRPNALSFLDADSPSVTPVRIERSMQGASTSKSSPTDSATSTSPSARSASSAESGFRDDRSDGTFGVGDHDHETDRSTSPECSVDGDPDDRLHTEGGDSIRKKMAKSRKRSYGTPEMPRGNAQHPHIPPEALTPRAPPNQQYPMHLPRAEKLPLTGYELLASRLSAKPYAHGGPRLRPMYRRFETLNHRILLHLQDEICELEEQLHRLDTADTQNRCLQNGILPASRRAESMSGGELQWHKTDILGKIGFKLEQYNRVLASFRETHSFPVPVMADVHEYRGYLASYAPIAEIESRFLDSADDLVYVGASDDSGDEDMMTDDSDDLATPMPRSNGQLFHSHLQPQPQRRGSLLSQSDVSRRHDEKSEITIKEQKQNPILAQLSIAAAVAIILPIFTFMVIPGFIGRMTVAILVGAGTVGALVQGKVVVGSNIQAYGVQELCVCVGLYGGVMAVLAGMIG
ncbi:hypothetical protein F5Y16DRAFT_411974 [Xylariaceae sp. FL0255]|nr:hypothetical protein F5Y16DRAFT_411974 [Xylariaceae sp. FL0255]